MAFAISTIKYTGKIREVALGTGPKALRVGGEDCYPFHLFEGQMPNRPLIAMEVWDMRPEDWPEACEKPFQDVLDDPGAWAKRCVEQYGAEAIVVQLKSTDPNGLDAPAEKASEAVGKVLDAVDVPVIVWGTANPAKDTVVLRKIAEDYQNRNLILGPVEEDNHKAIGAAALGFGHTVIASSPIDVNLAKQLNILLGNLGVPKERIIIDPTTGGLGYGLEYTYSVMERIRMAALVQEDDQLAQPMINNVGNEVWKTKEAKVGRDEAPDLGDPELRGILMETVTAVSFLMAGSDILILRHPETVKLVKKFMEGITAKRAEAPARLKVQREKAKPIAVAAKPAAAAAPAKAAAAPPPPPPKAAAAPPPPPSKAAAASPSASPLKVAPRSEKKAEVDLEEIAKAKAEAEAKAKAEAERKAREEAEARAREEAEAKAKAEAEAKAKAEARAKAEEELMELRRRRREERERKQAELHVVQKKDVQFGKGPEPGTAGPDGLYILRQLERWRLRGEGILRK
ncbi:MAG: acetyl-CoA decarbonylase/synthase complex subunit delta [Thermodesulfobacteriota bacterium]